MAKPVVKAASCTTTALSDHSGFWLSLCLGALLTNTHTYESVSPRSEVLVSLLSSLLTGLVISTPLRVETRWPFSGCLVRSSFSHLTRFSADVSSVRQPALSSRGSNPAEVVAVARSCEAGLFPCRRVSLVTRQSSVPPDR